MLSVTYNAQNYADIISWSIIIHEIWASIEWWDLGHTHED